MREKWWAGRKEEQVSTTQPLPWKNSPGLIQEHQATYSRSEEAQSDHML